MISQMLETSATVGKSREAQPSTIQKLRPSTVWLGQCRATGPCLEASEIVDWGCSGGPARPGIPARKLGASPSALKKVFQAPGPLRFPKSMISDPSKARPRVGHRADVTAQSQRRKVVLQVFAGVGGSWRGGRRPRIRGSGWPAPGEGRRWGPAVRRPPQSGTSRRGPKSGYLQAALVEIFGPVFRRLSAELDPRGPSISVGRAPCIHVHELQQFFSHVVTNSDFCQAAFKHPKERSAGLIFDLRCS